MFGESQFDSCRQMKTKIAIESTAPFGPDIFTVRPHSSVIGNRKVVVNRKNMRPHSSCVILTTLADDADNDGETDDDDDDVQTGIYRVRRNKGNHGNGLFPVPGSRAGSAAPCRDGSASKARRMRLHRLRLKREQKCTQAQQHRKKRPAKSVGEHPPSVGVASDFSDVCTDELIESEEASDLSDCSLDNPNRVQYASRGERKPTNANEYFDDPGFDINDPTLDTDLDIKVVYPESDFSSARVYRDSCRHYGVTPAAYFLRHLDDPDLNMKHYGLGARGIKPLAITLVSNPCITRLDLTDNWLCDIGGIYISDMLKENIHITEIDLSENNLGAQFTQELRFAMQWNTSIMNLTLRGNNLGDASAVHMASIIQTTTKIQRLDLSSNQFSSKSGQLLGASLKTNSTIKFLILAWNSISNGSEPIFESLSVNECMEELDISHNGIISRSMKSLSEALKVNSTLVDIDLSYNRINDNGLFTLVNGVSSNECLLSIKLAKNTFTSDGCLSIIGSILQNETSLIQFVDFGDTFVNNNFMLTLTELKEQRPDTDVRYHGDDTNLRKQQHHGGHPMQKLRRFLERKNMKLVDFFNKLDTDGSMSISRKEFLKGIEKLEIPLTEAEIIRLLNHLDKDGDGEIDYSELAQSHEEEE